ncbi:MAG: transporter [Deltaproteobacteria bacterium]|nr:transporter [Deltaproteobacteria bacterium]
MSYRRGENVKIYFVFLVALLMLLFPTGIAYAQEQSDMEKVLEKVKNLEDQVGNLKQAAEARRKLTITSEEEAQKEEEVLSAVDREEYTLSKEKTLGVQYSIEYSYSSADTLVTDANDLIGTHQYNHSMEHTISLYYGLLNNLTLRTGIPFVYRYYDKGGPESKDVTDIGDFTFGVSLRPFKQSKHIPNITLSSTLTLPTGRSPYKIDPAVELSTGSGFYSVSTGMSMSKTIDPIVSYGSVSYTHSLKRTGLHQNIESLVLTGVDPGDSIGFSLGMAYAMSYRVSINLGFSYSYGFSSTYHYDTFTREAPIGTSSTFSLGTGWKLSPTRTISVALGIGLTGSDNFSLSVGIPFDFNL